MTETGATRRRDRRETARPRDGRAPETDGETKTTGNGRPSRARSDRLARPDGETNIKLKLQDHSEIQNASCFGITKLNTRPYEADQARACKSQEEPEQVPFSGHTGRPITASSQPQQDRPQSHRHDGVDRKRSELLPHDDPRKHRNESKLGGVEDRSGGHREVGQPESVQEVIEANEDSDNGTGDKELGLHEEMSGLRVGTVA
ncbi:hypothetical protein Syun_003221 [Stephania yunnanensis]|uniref:Uncharacterized protein n=1 Tax=Stephania yunnanensis TaxID=152371 RepID=A0AAP0L2V2_9MAGN